MFANIFSVLDYYVT